MRGGVEMADDMDIDVGKILNGTTAIDVEGLRLIP
jgi:altronate dehydratase